MGGQNKIVSVVLIIISIMLIINACSDRATSVENNNLKLDSQTKGINTGLAQKHSNDPVVRKAESAFFELSREMPKFAGYHLDKDRNLVVLVKEVADISTAKQKVRSFVNNRYRRASMQFNNAQVTVKNADYSFRELSQWRDKIINSVLDVEGVVFFDLAEDRNRLVVAVENEAVRTDVESVLSDLEVPGEMVRIKVTGKIKSLATKNSSSDILLKNKTENSVDHPTLEDEIRPLLGGTEIKRVTSQSDLDFCTIGFNAVLGGVDVFFTASHCTENETVWQVDPGTEYFQPDEFVAPQNIGTELYDPACEDCRYSDAAAIKVFDDVNQDFGFLAETNGRGIDWSPGSKEILGKMEIIGDDRELFINSIVSKMGKESGWTAGFVSSTCVTVVWTEGNNSDLICQYIADEMFAEGGDSGGPVMSAPRNDEEGDIELVGILWAINNVEEVSFFSHMDGVRQDFNQFGTLETFIPPLDVTISGPSFIDQTGTHNWSANVQYEEGSVSYQWSIQYEGSSAWNTLGTSSSQSVFVSDDTDFKLRVVVTDAVDTDTDFQSVTVSLGECDPTEPPFEPCEN